MKIEWKDIIKNAALGNIIHILLSLVFTKAEGFNQTISYVLLAVLIIMWMLVGLKLGMGLKGKSESQLLMLGLISILPIAISLIICQGLGGVDHLSGIQNYNLYYFIGLPILFWNKPFLPIMNLFKNSNIYIQLDINIAVVFMVIFIGGYIGMYIRKPIKKE